MTDGKFADYSQVVTAAQLAVALGSGAFDAVCHYLGDDFALREENPDVVAAIRAMGWPQMGIFVPTLAHVDGIGDAHRATMYGFPFNSLLWLDIEPTEFDQDPGGWAAAANAWTANVWALGFLPGIYGVDRTVAACGTWAYAIWRALPGQCDPAGPGLASTFQAGRRAVQCAAGAFAGVQMDVSYSQFPISFPSPPLSKGGSVRLAYNGLIHRYWVAVDGLPHWEAIAGGSGGVDAERVTAGLLGSATAPGVPAVPFTLDALPDPVTDATGATVPRLSFECLWEDGITRQVVVLAESPWTVLEDWTPIDTDPAMARPATAPDSALRAALAAALGGLPK